jgi:outer membrane protein OmpA-like peptidoglycan-associated protein
LREQIQQKWDQLMPLQKQSLSVDTGIEQSRESGIGIPIPRPENDEIKGNQTVATTPPVPRDKIIIPFPHNSNTFLQLDRKELKEVTQILLQNPSLSVKIAGYTDSLGPEDYNKALSLLRAEMVSDFLLESGVDTRQITTYGLGSASPLGSNKSPEGRRLNRRVELEFAEKRE